MQAHRLMLLAQAQGKAHETTEALFVEQYAQGDTNDPKLLLLQPHVYRYERGGNISLVDTLVRVGHEVGLLGVEAFLQSSEGLEEMLSADQHAKTR